MYGESFWHSLTDCPISNSDSIAISPWRVTSPSLCVFWWENNSFFMPSAIERSVQAVLSSSLCFNEVGEWLNINWVLSARLQILMVWTKGRKNGWIELFMVATMEKLSDRFFYETFVRFQVLALLCSITIWFFYFLQFCETLNFPITSLCLRVHFCFLYCETTTVPMWNLNIAKL